MHSLFPSVRLQRQRMNEGTSGDETDEAMWSGEKNNKSFIQNVSLFVEDNVALSIEGSCLNAKPLLRGFSQRPCARHHEWVNAHLWWLWVVMDKQKSALEIQSIYQLLHFSVKDSTGGGSADIHLCSLHPSFRSDGTHQACVCVKLRHPKASWTASSVSGWPRWRSSSHLRSPW